MSSMKNKYIIRSRISEAKFREILKYFAKDIEASKISNLTKILMSKECEVLESNERSEVKDI